MIIRMPWQYCPKAILDYGKGVTFGLPMLNQNADGHISAVEIDTEQLPPELLVLIHPNYLKR